MQSWNPLLAVLAGLLLVLPVSADDKKKKSDSPDEKAAIEAMMKAAEPGPMHKKLEPLVGKWEATMKMWMDPSKPPTESKATAEMKWVMGNRYILMHVNGEFAGMKFEGVGVTGYDNLKETYVGAWIDNFGTGISTSAGKVDDTGKVFTFESEEIDPVSKKKMKTREVLKFIDADTYEDTFFKITDGKELKVMELTAKRAK